MICFFLPSVRFLSVGTALGFYGCGTRLSVQLHTEGFSCQLLFLRKGRICRKFTLSRRIKRDGRPLHLIKPNRYDRERSRGSGNRTWVEKGMPVWNTKAGKPDMKGDPGKHDRRVEKDRRS